MADQTLRDSLHETLTQSLSALDTGPISDTPYQYATSEPDGALSLFLRNPDGSPDASVDVEQLVEAIAPLFDAYRRQVLLDAAEDIVASGEGSYDDGADAVFAALRARAEEKS
ncbi:hypothetical protein [Microbacterium sp. 77mftsu3.1]|uniref:hypothetical protein n=1 Tax=Microbacterium sp. 77mftsu3.1 TaxID=1761802 RepID=UPI00037D21AA|nr:hypothetical protein [Microbacterium sp. 77mftsu3.1]SDH42637.1 hypothetical protein SAMN04488590_3312 [Microbacterium sp. 77mftsu3.1]